MDTMTSSEFRRRYATLSATTIVTVNGHPIGEWTPLGYPEEVRHDATTDEVEITRDSPRRAKPTTERFNTRPFTPVPKAR